MRVAGVVSGLMQSGHNAGNAKVTTAPSVPRQTPIQVLTRPMLLDFSDRTRTGVFNMVWPLPEYDVRLGRQDMQSGHNAGMQK